MKSLATSQIRMDHTHALTAFHRYRPDADPDSRKGLARHICAALEIHGRLEEEIFYPAMQAAGVENELISQHSLPEHAEQHRLIAQVRALEPEDPAFEEAFMDLMRLTIHHVADEETMLLPQAERQIDRERLNEIGRAMVSRRLQLSKEMSGEIIGSLNQATSPTVKMLAGGALLAGTYLIGKALSRGSGEPRMHR